MKRLKLLRLSLRTYVAGLCVIAIVSILIPLLGEKLFWGTEESVYTTQWVFAAYAIFFVAILGLLIPALRWILGSLKKSKTHPIDAALTVIIIIASAIPILLLTTVTLPLIRMELFEKYKYKIYNFSASAALFLLGTPIRFHGHIRRKDGKPVIVIANHTSGPIDYVGISMSMGVEPFTILAGINLAHNKSTWGDRIISKTIGPIVRDYSIAIDRTDDASRAGSAKRIFTALREHKNIAVFPEGTRNPALNIFENKVLLQEFEEGIFRIAWKAKTPIQPLVFDWPVIWRGKNDPRWGFRPTTVHAHFGDLVYPENFSSCEELQQYCWDVMHQKLLSSKRVQRFLQEQYKEAA